MIMTPPNDTRTRCSWPGEDPLYVAYHDDEWGRLTTSDEELFGKLCLEGFQSGLAWITILRKRENFRRAFAGFDIDAVAAFGEGDVERLVGDAGIVRHRRKIQSAINNATRAREIRDEFGSLFGFFRQYAEVGSGPRSRADIQAVTTGSTAMATELKRRGFSWVGPTTSYAFMQAMGLVNDHLPECFARGECEALRGAL
ncbi:MAG: DNA-3-methyladenine glycosylase I [Myxococcota bacterium]|jgi:DNA-3-methyladenine glycosylase I